MKIVLAHNYYGFAAPSGENTVYQAEAELLRGQGHTVIEFTRHSDEIRNRGIFGTVQGALSTLWNPFSARRLRQVLSREQPDILHVHNTFPLLSPSIFHAAKGLPVATVLTLHNYRTFCAAGIPMRNGFPCTECLDRKSILPSLKYGCYRGSRLATVPMAAMIALHRKAGTWDKHVDVFVALTAFQRDALVAAGLPAVRMHIKPHFYPNPPIPLQWDERQPKVVFIGRLGREKGVHVLVEAWRNWGADAPFLELIGDGPEKTRLQETVAGAGLEDKITFAGQLPFEEVQRRLARARLLVLPSLCFEGFPMVIREALALGVPVAASRIGSIPCIIADGETGVLFEPNDAVDLERVVKYMWKIPQKLSAMAMEARKTFEKSYTANTNHETLMRIYEAALSRRKIGYRHNER